MKVEKVKYPGIYKIGKTTTLIVRVTPSQRRVVGPSLSIETLLDALQEVPPSQVRENTRNPRKHLNHQPADYK